VTGAEGKPPDTLCHVPSPCRDIQHWMHNQSFWSKDPQHDAPPYLGGERAQQYMRDLTGYLHMLRAGYPDTRLVAVHTMAQRSPRSQPGHLRPVPAVKGNCFPFCRGLGVC